MKDSNALVKDNRQVAQDTYLMTLMCELSPFTPGQFLMLRLTSTCEPFLRRPLAILSYNEGAVEILYKVRGEGTSLLAEKKKGEELSVLGPLGKGFSDPRPEEEAVYIAGGTGLPPILAMAERMKRGRLIIGTYTKDDIPLWQRMQNIGGVEITATTEDGSLGIRGVATQALDGLLKTIQQPCVIYACGPTGMLKAAASLAKDLGARCEVSIEERMACGFGVCSACAVRTTTGNQRVCTQGPVFDASNIEWRQ